MVDGNVAPYGAMVLTVALVAIVGVLLVRWFRARPRVRSALADVQFHASALAALAEGSGQTVLVLDSAGAIKGVVGADGARELGLELRPGHLLLEAAPEDLAEPLRCLFELARRSPGERVTQRAVRAFGTASAPELEISAVDGRRLPSFGGIVVSFRVALDGPDAATSARSPRGLDAIFQQTATPIFLVDDASGSVVDLNPAAEQTYAWPREELIERSFDLISAPEGRQEGEPSWVSASAEGDGMRHAVHRRRDGSRLLVREDSAAVAGTSGSCRLVLVDNVDASVRSQHLLSGELALTQSILSGRDFESWLDSLVYWLLDGQAGEARIAGLWVGAEDAVFAQRGVSRGAADAFGAMTLEALGEGLSERDVRRTPLEGGPLTYWSLLIRDGKGAPVGVVSAGLPRGRSPSEATIGRLRLAARLGALAAEREQVQRSVLNTQRTQALAQMSGSVARDLNDLLTVILGEGDFLSANVEGDPAARTGHTNLMEAAQRASDIAARLMHMVRQRPHHKELLSLDGVLRDARPWLTALLGEGGEVSLSLPEVGPSVECDRSLLETVLLNLVLSVRDASAINRALAIALSIEASSDPRVLDSGTVSPGRYAVLGVSEAGQAVDRALPLRAPAGRPGDSSGGAFSQGLSVAVSFAQEQGGGLEVLRAEPAGMSVKIWLPLASRNASAESIAADRSKPDRVVRLLLVEDEELVAQFVARTLERAGLSVEVLRTADEAVARLRDDADFDVLITDVDLPGSTNGLELALWCERERPEVDVIVATGLDSAEFADSIKGSVLAKPFNGPKLLSAVQGRPGAQGSVQHLRPASVQP